jgi:hypothetical protein
VHDSTRRTLSSLLLAVLGPALACSSFGTGADGPGTAGEDAAARDGAADAASSDAEPPAEHDANVLDASLPLDAGGHLVAFVTLSGYADVTTTAAADAKCAAEAAGRLPGRFVAWASEPGAPAPSRLVDRQGKPVDGPWFRLDGARVVATRAALSNTASKPLESAISVNPVNGVTAGAVWTGTLADGGVGKLCGAAAQPTTGIASMTGPGWTEQTSFAATCGASLLVYCFQVDD